MISCIVLWYLLLRVVMFITMEPPTGIASGQKSCIIRILLLQRYAFSSSLHGRNIVSNCNCINVRCIRISLNNLIQYLWLRCWSFSILILLGIVYSLRLGLFLFFFFFESLSVSCTGCKSLLQILLFDDPIINEIKFIAFFHK